MKINKTKLHITIYVVAIIFLGFSFSRIFLKPAEKTAPHLPHYLHRS